MQPGQEVIAKAYRGKEVKLMVVQIIDDIVLVCTMEEYKRALAEQRPPITAGCKFSSVRMV
jgi:hypothetical protein